MPILKIFLKKYILSGMKTNTQDSLARIKEEDLENGKEYARHNCRLKPKIREEMLREDLASVCMCIYSLPSSIKDKCWYLFYTSQNFQPSVNFLLKLRWLTSEAADLLSIKFLKSGRTAKMPEVWLWANANNNNKVKQENSENNRQADTILPLSKNFRKN